ncbi:MAG TPA: asparagine synthase (glutamine-hydrolyzing) [Pyrinomonadaceae bacterium]|nr:asparagine synthase (glutamine-hydrolyzing) [Pyrinomonadaceae bacterium]
MCGIAGIAGSKDAVDARGRLGSMLRALEHRGPDDQGIETWGAAMLGHRRLAILDLSPAGHQPMLTPDRKIGVAFNGAIYNFVPLRSELEQKGYRFNSTSDTEVLVHGYIEWGIDGLVSKIDGMFSIAIWDDDLNKLFLVRDRLGVKPLVYVEKDGMLAFASSVRALRQAGFCGELDEKGITEYLEFGFLTDDRSIYRGVQKLPAASLLEWHCGSTTVRSYWSLPDTEDNHITFEDAVEETERLFIQAVEKRLQADVPVGALLSGGIDSSLVCWAIARLGADVTAFTIGVQSDEWDESPIAVETARKIGIKHKVLNMSPDAPMDLSSLTRAFGEPFACASALGLLAISREVRREATVLLTGDGGDDIFLGYPEHLHFRAAERVAATVPRLVSGPVHAVVSAMPSVGIFKRADSFLSYARGGLGAVTRVRDGLPVYQRHQLLGDRLAAATHDHRTIPMTSGRSLLKDFLGYDRRTRFVGEYLPKVDGATMFHALEARSPFLDAGLWEFASQLPVAVRLRRNTLKAVLREIVRKRLDPELARGGKKGFGVPVQRWLTGNWRPAFEEMMNGSVLEKGGWINSKSILRLLDRSSDSNWAPRQLWFILVLESWLRFENEWTG